MHLLCPDLNFIMYVKMHNILLIDTACSVFSICLGAQHKYCIVKTMIKMKGPIALREFSQSEPKPLAISNLQPLWKVKDLVAKMAYMSEVTT